MSEGKILGQDGKPVASLKQGFTLVISLNEKGQVQVAGPFATPEGRDVCLKMIGGAITAIIDHAAGKGGQPPMIVQPGFLNMLKANLHNIGKKFKRR